MDERPGRQAHERHGDCDAARALSDDRGGAAGALARAVRYDPARRALFKKLGAVSLGLALAPRAVAAVPAGAQTAGHTLVLVFLRGGLDALAAVPPMGDPHYDAARQAALRPTIRVGSPLPLDAMFGLHPSLAALHGGAWSAGELAVVHAVGTPTWTRSHFAAQSMVERGAASTGGDRSGWLARYLAERPSSSAFQAVAMAQATPRSLVGPAVQPVRVTTLSELALNVDDASRERAEADLRMLHEGFSHPVGAAGRAASTVLPRARALAAEPPGYPATAVGRSLAAVAALVRGGAGLEAAAVDVGGYDLHTGLGGADDGALARLLRELAEALAAFRRDLVAAGSWQRVSVVVLSEFGRRVRENGNAGTDHGKGGALFVLGGGVRGGVYTRSWPGLADSALVDGDLAVSADYRDVLAEVVDRRLGAGGALGRIFPGHNPSYLGLC